MKIKIDEINRRAVIEIAYGEYYLVKTEPDTAEYVEFYPYALAERIDMSYKGKDDQQGFNRILLTDEEAEKLRGIVDEIL